MTKVYRQGDANVRPQTAYRAKCTSPLLTQQYRATSEADPRRPMLIGSPYSLRKKKQKCLEVITVNFNNPKSDGLILTNLCIPPTMTKTVTYRGRILKQRLISVCFVGSSVQGPSVTQHSGKLSMSIPFAWQTWQRGMAKIANKLSRSSPCRYRRVPSL